MKYSVQTTKGHFDCFVQTRRFFCLIVRHSPEEAGAAKNCYIVCEASVAEVVQVFAALFEGRRGKSEVDVLRRCVVRDERAALRGRGPGHEEKRRPVQGALRVAQSDRRGADLAFALQRRSNVM